MRSSIRTSFLYIIDALFPLLRRLRTCSHDVHLPNLHTLVERSYRMREERPWFWKLLSERGSAAPIFEGRKGGEENKESLGEIVNSV